MPLPRPEVLPPEVAARRVGPPTITYRYWKSVPVDRQEWDAKYHMKFGKCWEHIHPIDGPQIIYECCKAKDKWKDRVKHYVLWFLRDENYRWFTPPADKHHIPEWWNWLQTFQKRPPQSSEKRSQNIADFYRPGEPFFQAVPCELRK